VTFRLGEWTINPESGRVRSGEKETVLQPQVMQLLVYFAEHPREVISLDQMIESVWSGKPMTSSSVYNALNAIRSALGDDTRNPRYLETIPRRGYRLIAEVAESPESPTTTSTRNYVSAAALLMLAIGLRRNSEPQ
jgi:DNA-binding winged helix-turn-helix (wHTH) protein